MQQNSAIKVNVQVHSSRFQRPLRNVKKQQLVNEQFLFFPRAASVAALQLDKIVVALVDFVFTYLWSAEFSYYLCFILLRKINMTHWF